MHLGTSSSNNNYYCPSGWFLMRMYVGALYKCTVRMGLSRDDPKDTFATMQDVNIIVAGSVSVQRSLHCIMDSLSPWILLCTTQHVSIPA